MVFETPVFSLRRDRKHRASSETESHDFYIMESVDWVNVIPLTEEGEVVFIEIHRHGTDEVSLEIPGGMIDPEDPSPMAAAVALAPSTRDALLAFARASRMSASASGSDERPARSLTTRKTRATRR